MKMYTTGQVAKICKMTPVKARKLLDNGGAEIEFIESKFRRQSTRRIRLKNLMKLMKDHGFSFDGFDGSDADAQKAILYQKATELREALLKAKKRGDIFLKAGLPYKIEDLEREIFKTKNRGEAELFVKIVQSSDVFMAIFKEALGSLEDVSGITRNNAWAKAFRKMADLIEQHTIACIANSKKK